MSAELHIAGIVVHTLPESVESIARAVAALPGAEVHAASRDGRLVITLEAPGAREIAAQMDGIRGLAAVLSASLVYQHNEPLEAMMEEVGNENHET